MSRASKKIISSAVEALNDAIDNDPRAENILDYQFEGLTTLDLINAVLAAAAEGATIVAARETDGTLVGFVPKRTKATAESAVAQAPTPETRTAPYDDSPRA